MAITTRTIISLLLEANVHGICCRLNVVTIKLNFRFDGSLGLAWWPIQTISCSLSGFPQAVLEADQPFEYKVTFSTPPGAVASR